MFSFYLSVCFVLLLYHTFNSEADSRFVTSFNLNLICNVHTNIFSVETKRCVQETRRLYMQKLDEVSKLQKNFVASIAQQKKNVKELSKSLRKWVTCFSQSV